MNDEQNVTQNLKCDFIDVSTPDGVLKLPSSEMVNSVSSKKQLRYKMEKNGITECVTQKDARELVSRLNSGVEDSPDTEFKYLDSFLDNKELSYALAVCSGKSKKTAFKLAFGNDCKLTVDEIDRRESVRFYIEKFKKANISSILTVNKAIEFNNKSNIINIAFTRIKSCSKRNDDTNIIKYLDFLAKINGFYEQNSQNLPVTQTQNNILNVFSTDELKNILNA